jgi:hypothetical protein
MNFCERHVDNCTRADPAYGAGVAKALGIDFRPSRRSPRRRLRSLHPGRRRFPCHRPPNQPTYSCLARARYRQRLRPDRQRCDAPGAACNRCAECQADKPRPGPGAIVGSRQCNRALMEWPDSEGGPARHCLKCMPIAASERTVVDALARLMRDRTTLLITHRLQALRHADAVLVLESGRIRTDPARNVHVASHQEMVRSQG